MNYYEHHLGDYVRDAAHLTLLEEGAYRRLIDAYYVRESPLPLDIRECKKLARVTRNPAEHRAVEYVLREFFVQETDGYHQKRCDEEIQRFKAKSDSAKASASARWSHANASNPHMRNGSGRITNGNANASIPHSVRNALQTPDSSNQSPDTHPPLPLPGGRGGVGNGGKGSERIRRNGRAGAERWTPPKSADELEAEARDRLEREEAARAVQ